MLLGVVIHHLIHTFFHASHFRVRDACVLITCVLYSKKTFKTHILLPPGARC